MVKGAIHKMATGTVYAKRDEGGFEGHFGPSEAEGDSFLTAKRLFFFTAGSKIRALTVDGY